MTDTSARVLAERARLLAQPLPAPAGVDGEARFLLFAVGAAGFAVPLASAALVRTIVDPEPVTGGPPWLLGLASIAGRTMPVIGMTSYLTDGAQPSPPAGGERRLVIVIEADDLEAALVADTLDGIEQFRKDATAPFPAGTSPRATAVSSGLCGDRVILDPKRLVHDLRGAFEVTVASAPSRRAWLPAAGGDLTEGA